MRATSALCLLLLSGCAAGVQQPHEITLRPRSKILRINGTFEPVTFAVDHKRYAVVVTGREACQTNDPMPTGQFDQPAPRMLNVRPLRVAPMPNACPVTVPLAGKSVLTSSPRPKTVPAPAPAKSQP